MKTPDAAMYVKLDEGRQPDMVKIQRMEDDVEQTADGTVNIDPRYRPDAVNIHTTIAYGGTIPDVVKTM